jgi:hypothetical protein
MDGLLVHKGHELELATCGDKRDPASVTVECLDCACVPLELRPCRDGSVAIGAIDDTDALLEKPGAGSMEDLMEHSGHQVELLARPEGTGPWSSWDARTARWR